MNPAIDPTNLPGSYLLTGGHVYSPVDPFATSMMVIDAEIAWIGSDAGAQVHRDAVSSVIDLDGALVTPAFVDAHVHATATGLGLIGIDLSGSTSARHLLETLHDRCAILPRSALVWGHGWDDSDWLDHVPDREAIDRATSGRLAYLSRVDVHSAMVSTSLVQQCPELTGLDGFDPTGPLRMAAHLRAREFAFASLDPVSRRDAQHASLNAASRQGIASLHEMGGPGISSADDLRSVISLGQDPTNPEVIGYWGALEDIDQARALGAVGCAGDLFIDGSLGSHTACLRAPYADEPGTGVAYLSIDQVSEHLVHCTQAGLQGGFHVIGDAAMDIACRGFIAARAIVGDEALRKVGHRLEHAEMMDAEHIRLLAELNVVASMQPAFDAAWGGESGMYSTRLGSARARSLNPFAQAMSAGVPLAFGSDSPVTALDPWETVRAAAFHHTPEHRISTRAAFHAHTRGGRRAARQSISQPGVLRDGAPATYCVWEVGELTVGAPDSRISAWSTDPRSGTPGLPDLSDDAPVPTCLLTVRDGHVLHRSEGHLEGSG